MKKNLVVITLLVLFVIKASSQNYTQTVRGIVVEADSKSPLKSAQVVILGTSPLIGKLTDNNGQFKFDNVPIGRIELKITYIGFEPKTIRDIVVNTGKEVVLEVNLKESAIKKNGITVLPTQNKGEAINDMAIISSRSISVEETKRYAGTWDDPSMILNNFAGVTTSGTSNDIIVRGNSPKYIQWRLEGVEIFAPNHQTDQNGAISGFSCINNKLLNASDFFTGAFTSEYGNVLSGIYDLKYRAGNNEKFEGMLGLGLMGTDFTIEGPFKSDYNGSYLFNYRFSNIGLIQKLGLVGEIDGVSTTFQDANLKIVLPTESIGKFSIFGLFGVDNLFVKNTKPTIIPTPGDNQMKPNLTQDFDQKNKLANIGISHIYNFSDNSYLKSSITYSGIALNSDVFETNIIESNNAEKYLNYICKIRTSNFKASSTYFNKIDSKNIIIIGANYSLINENNNQSHLSNDSILQRVYLVDFEGNIESLQNFITWKHIFNDNISLVAGLHNMNVFYNKKYTIEPRIAINWKLDYTSSLNIGYGNHSRMENIHNYFSKVKQYDGTIVEPNKNLDLLKAEHYVIGFNKSITESMSTKVELYYQHLYNLPVENDKSSFYSTINEGAEYRYVALVNKGTGHNYGLEATVEQFFNNNYYFLINASIFDSKYKSLEGVERNTQFNSNYIFNLLFGKEFDKIGENKNQTLTLNSKIFVSGGQRYIPLLRDANGNIAVDAKNNKFWDYSKAYNNRFDAIIQLNLSVSYKFNLQSVTHEIFLDLPNILDRRGRLYEFYDESKTNKVAYVTQMQFLPNLMYRVYF